MFESAPVCLTVLFADANFKLMNKKITIAIISILALALVAGGFWVWKNKHKVEVIQQAEQIENNQELEINTSDWKTYINEGWKYSIKYPSNLYIKPNAQGDKFPGDESTPFDGGQTLIISDIEKMGIQDVMPEERIHIIITTLKKEEGQSLYSYLVKSFSFGDNISEVVVNGISGFQNKSVNEYSSVTVSSSSVFLSRDNWVYYLYSLNDSGENFDSKNYKLMKKIISTFQLTD